MNRTVIIHADVMQGLRTMPDASVHMVMTSPPYWGLRDYPIPPSVWGGDPAHAHAWAPAGKRHRGEPAGKSHARAGRDNTQRDAVADIRLGEYCACGAWRGQLGLEPTIELYVEHVVSVFREVRRVLRHDGTCWLNIGDTYSTGGRGGYPDATTSTLQGSQRNQNASRVKRAHAGKHERVMESGQVGRAWVKPPAGVKSKELCLIPEKLVIALQADGWWVRRDIIWFKESCMPESALDRPTTAHEYVWLLSKKPKYYYDRWAIAEASSPDTHARMKRAHAAYQAPGQDPQRGAAGPRPNTNGVNRKIKFPAGWDATGSDHRGTRGRYTPKQNESFSTATSPDLVALRNKRSVWMVNPEPFAEAHFATFPTALVEPAIRAGTSAHGICPTCFAPWRRVVDKKALAREPWENYAPSVILDRITTGWRPTCKHIYMPRREHSIVLDPFGGAGTVGLVANRLRRDAVLIEVSHEYVQMAAQRIRADSPLLSDVSILNLEGGDTDGKEAETQEQAEASAGSRLLSQEVAPA